MDSIQVDTLINILNDVENISRLVYVWEKVAISQYEQQINIVRIRQTNSVNY